MMTDTCGLTSCEPFARWDHDSSCWKTSEATSLWALTLSSLTLPAWGGLHDGELCEHPTPELATSGLDCSSLPTPRTSDTNGAGSHGDGGLDLRTAVTMLPTPRATDGPKGGPGQVNGRGVPDSLPAISALLPTPRAQNGEERNSNIWARPLNQPQNLENALALLPTPLATDGTDAPANFTPSVQAICKGLAHRGPRLSEMAVGNLLPTPTSQAAKHGETPDTTANGYGSNLWDLPSLLPTPTSRDHKGANQRGDATCLHGAITAQPSPDGKPSSDDQHQHQLSLDELALPA